MSVPLETVSPAEELPLFSLVDEAEELFDSELLGVLEPEPDPEPDPVPVSEVPLEVVELVVLLEPKVEAELLVITSDDSLLLVLLLKPEVRPLPFSLANSLALFDDSPKRLTTI